MLATNYAQSIRTRCIKRKYKNKHSVPKKQQPTSLVQIYKRKKVAVTYDAPWQENIKPQ